MSAQRVLIIDDDELLSETLKDALSMSGYDVQVESDASKGLDIARETAPQVIVLDVQMPGIDGFEVLRQLKGDTKTRSIPVLMFSSFNKPHLKIKALESGADDYITKDTSIAELIARTRASLRKAGTVVGGQVALQDAMTGDIADIGFDTLLQTLQITMRKARVRLHDVGGEVILCRGMLLDCRFRQFRGHDAFVRLFFIARGKFSVQILGADSAEPPQDQQTVQPRLQSQRDVSTNLRTDNATASSCGDMSLSTALVDVAVASDDVHQTLCELGSLRVMVTLTSQNTKIQALEAMRQLFPMSVLQLLVSMDDDVRSNAHTIDGALKAGLLNLIPT